MRVLAACSLIVVRCCWIAVARFMLSSLFSPVTFLRYSFASFGARCTLIALRCSNFADNSLQLVTPFLLLAVRYLFLGAKFLVTRPLGARCVLLTAPCSLLLTRYSPPNCRFCLLASSRLLITARPRGLFIAARGLLLLLKK